MLEIINRTPHTVALIPFSDKAGRDHAGVVIKGTWSLGPGEDPTLAEEQQPILRADTRNGPAPDASLRYAADTGWPKLATDIALVGHAHARGARCAELDVGVQIGELRKTVRVFGDRVWFKSVLAWDITKPRPFDRVPLVYERAYGGRDTTHADPKHHAWEPRNPVGTGFAVSSRPERLEGLLLPNLEDPRNLIATWKDRPPPAGFGFIDGFWAPRARFAGTYDEAWQSTRAPLLPADFDEHFFNAAHPDLVASGHLTGGEPVLIVNADPSGRIAFRVPRRRFDVLAVIKGRQVPAEPRLDTLWIDTDNRLVVLVWRAAIPCPRCFLGIEAVFVKEVKP
jgi:hypothetical protein